MSSSNYPIIVPSNFDIEDAFSFTNTPGYTLPSPDYFPASPRNTSPDPSADLSKYLLASLAILPFHNDLYMKVMQAYNATTRFLSSSSTDSSAPLQVFDNEESSHKTHLEHHEEQIKNILNHLDELPLERIEQVEEKIEGLGNGRIIIQRDFDSLETKLQKARTQITGLQKDQMEHDDEIVLARAPKRTSTSAAPVMTQAAIQTLFADSVVVALEAQGTKGAVDLIRWFERTESWNSFAQPIGIEEAYKTTWFDLKKLLIKKYCPRTEVKKIEDEFYHLAVKGNDLKTYVRRFQKLAILCPTMVPNSEKLIEVFIEGLPRSIEGNVTASKPQTLKEAITIT
nr:reverse transcriptase domain-containing protein [Tanacetum cinerariifolium]